MGLMNYSEYLYLQHLTQLSAARSRVGDECSKNQLDIQTQ